MGSESESRYYCYTDAGGTFTDTLLIDQAGDMWSGKAPTTPGSLDVGHIASIEAAVAGLGITMKELLSRSEVIAFGTTAIINTIVQRSGARVGAIITKGFERVPSIGRASQNYSEYSWSDILHSATHRHLKDLVAYQDIVGVTERIDANGKAFIPLYEDEVEDAVNKLIDKKVESIIILFLYSFMDPSHELRAKEIAEEIIEKRGAGIRVFTSYEVSPTMKELSRFNTLAVEAYAGDIARRSLAKSEERLVALGAKTRLQATLSHGGLMPAAYAHMVDTAMSGPAGGILGGKYLGDVYGYKNIITSDVGGTSFDVGLITGGRINIKTEPVVARFILSAPCAEVTSIGAGGGTIAYLDPFTNRLKVGPQSAGSVPGPACYGKGGENPTVTDADLVLGYIDPDYFLGGRMKLDKSLAEKAIKEKIADPLGLSVVDAATGIKEIIDAEMENYCRSLISTRGYAVEDYVLLAFGGAGPTHAAGYTKNTKYKEVIVTPFASVFCAFGGATADYSRQYLQGHKGLRPLQGRRGDQEEERADAERPVGRPAKRSPTRRWRRPASTCKRWSSSNWPSPATPANSTRSSSGRLIPGSRTARNWMTSWRPSSRSTRASTPPRASIPRRATSLCTSVSWPRCPNRNRSSPPRPREQRATVVSKARGRRLRQEAHGHRDIRDVCSCHRGRRCRDRRSSSTSIPPSWYRPSLMWMWTSTECSS